MLMLLQAFGDLLCVMRKCINTLDRLSAVWPLHSNVVQVPPQHADKREECSFESINLLRSAGIDKLLLLMEQRPHYAKECEAGEDRI